MLPTCPHCGYTLCPACKSHGLAWDRPKMVLICIDFGCDFRIHMPDCGFMPTNKEISELISLNTLDKYCHKRKK